MFDFFQHKNVVSQLWLNRVFVVVIILLALLAGYFYTKIQELEKACQVSEAIVLIENISE